MAKKKRAQPLPPPRHRRSHPAPARRHLPAAPAAAPPSPLGWERSDLVIAAGAALVALVFYLWRLTSPGDYVFDEIYHAFTAGELAAGNSDAYLWSTTPPPGVAYEWTHPALSKLIMQVGITLFGNTELGWRSMSALFGGAGIGLIYTMGRLMFNRVVGLFAATLLFLDGLWLGQSRIGMNDVFLATFIMAAYLAFFFYLRNAGERRLRYLWLIGAALGLALATKWSAAYSAGLIGVIVVLREGRLLLRPQHAPVARVALTIAGALAVVPLGLYIGSYIQFFAMGHSFDQWRELQQQMWWYHSSLKADHDWASRWWTWPLMIKPVWYFADYNTFTPEVSNIFGMGNPLIWWAFLPAVAFALYDWHESRYRTVALGVVLLGFFGQWIPWALSPRISFMYHMLPSVPFGCLAIAHALARLRAPRLAIAAYLAPVAAAFIYFFPIYTGWPITRGYTDQHYWNSEWNPTRPNPTTGADSAP